MARLKISPQFKEAYEKLNVEQRKAVDTIDGPVMVVAGPGTGKTQVLALRIANILLKTDTPPHAILALTFTESGAQSMRQRLVELIGPDGYYVFMHTFHGFCSGVIREHPDRFRITEESEPLTDLERIDLFTEILGSHQFNILKPLNTPHLYIKSIIRSIQELKREGYTPEKFAKFLGQQAPGMTDKQLQDKQWLKLQELAEVFEIYQQQLRKRNRYDYEDMINLVNQAFSEEESLLRSYQERFHYFLADEYQDTNSAQNRLLFQLASFWGHEANIFVVGDPNQSIYRFQGASLENVLAFKQNFPNVETVLLTHNYRSQQTILNSAHAVIEHNTMKGSTIMPEIDPQPLRAAGNIEPENLRLAQFPSGVVEFVYIGTQIKNLISQGVPAEEIAVIYRDNSDADDLAEVFARMGIAYNLEGGDNVLRSADVKRLLCLMHTICKLRSGDEDIDLFTLLNFEFLEIDSLDVLKLSRFASRHSINFLEAIYKPELEFEQLSDLPKIKQFIEQLMTWGNLDQEMNLVEFYERLVNESKFLTWILDQPDSVRKLNRLNSLFKQLKQMVNVNHNLKLSEFLRIIQLMEIHNLPIMEEDLNIDVNAIRLSTAHKVKGQEYQYVFITKAYDGKWGNRRIPELIKLPASLISQVDLSVKEKNEDERRLFYVALTRAKQYCCITSSDTYDGKQVAPAMFVKEIPDEYCEMIDTREFQTQVKEILQTVFTPVLPNATSPQEDVFLQDALSDFSMNPTALNTFLMCAYKFKLDHLLRTPVAKPAVMAFGSAVHRALEDFFKRFQAERKLPPLTYLEERFDYALDQELLTTKDKLGWRARGHEALHLYVQYYGESVQIPIRTEYFFGGRFNPVYLNDIPLTGKVDKVEYVDKTKNTVRIVDYKTGNPKSRNEIEGKTKHSEGNYKRQLVFYQLLAELDRTFSYKVVETQLDFVEKNARGKLKRESFSISKQEVEELKNQIKDMMQKIRRLEFPRTTNYKHCETCRYQLHCWPEGIPHKHQLEGEQMTLV